MAAVQACAAVAHPDLPGLHGFLRISEAVGRVRRLLVAPTAIRSAGTPRELIYPAVDSMSSQPRSNGSATTSWSLGSSQTSRPTCAAFALTALNDPGDSGLFAKGADRDSRRLTARPRDR
jgi:hypothetical protein